MPNIKTGTKVRYAHTFLQDLKNNRKEDLVGQADRIIASSPALVYVRWNDGSYNAVSEQHLEAV